MNKVLVIDDDVKLCKAITRFMSDVFIVEYINQPNINKSEDLKQYIYQECFDIVIFDLEIGGINGLELFYTLMPLQGISTIFLSGTSEANNRIEALQAGADDFLQKPIDLRELQLKLEKRITVNKLSIYEFIGNYKIDNQTEQIYLNDELLELPPLAERLLKYMLHNQNRNLSRSELVNNIWGYPDDGGSRIIDNTINTIRNSTRDPSILTIRGIGYKYEKIKKQK